MGATVPADRLAAVALAMPVVWSDRHRLHEPGGEVWVGVRTPGTELPERAERIREALAAAGAAFVEAQTQPDDGALAIHDAALVAYLARAWEDWDAAGLPVDPGQDRVVPYLFPHPGLFAEDQAPVTATAVTARAGQFAYDTMTLIGPGTWEAARAAVDVAVTAADLVLAGAPAAYACCRPPGHHVTRTCFGGSCYLNNSAAAAARLRAGARRPGRRGRRRRPSRQRHAGDLLRRLRACWSARSTSTRAPAGFRTSSASRARTAAAPAQAPTATSRWRPAAATTPGSRRSPSSRSGRARAERRRSSSRSASTPRAATPRARSP